MLDTGRLLLIGSLAAVCIFTAASLPAAAQAATSADIRRVFEDKRGDDLSEWRRLHEKLRDSWQEDIHPQLVHSHPKVRRIERFIDRSSDERLQTLDMDLRQVLQAFEMLRDALRLWRGMRCKGADEFQQKLAQATPVAWHVSDAARQLDRLNGLSRKWQGLQSDWRELEAPELAGAPKKLDDLLGRVDNRMSRAFDRLSLPADLEYLRRDLAALAEAAQQETGQSKKKDEYLKLLGGLEPELSRLQRRAGHLESEARYLVERGYRVANLIADVDRQANEIAAVQGSVDDLKQLAERLTRMQETLADQEKRLGELPGKEDVQNMIQQEVETKENDVRPGPPQQQPERQQEAVLQLYRRVAGLKEQADRDRRFGMAGLGVMALIAGGLLVSFLWARRRIKRFERDHLTAQQVEERLDATARGLRSHLNDLDEFAHDMPAVRRLQDSLTALREEVGDLRRALDDLGEGQRSLREELRNAAERDRRLAEQAFGWTVDVVGLSPDQIEASAENWASFRKRAEYLLRHVHRQKLDGMLEPSRRLNRLEEELRRTAEAVAAAEGVRADVRRLQEVSEEDTDSSEAAFAAMGRILLAGRRAELESAVERGQGLLRDCVERLFACYRSQVAEGEQAGKGDQVVEALKAVDWPRFGIQLHTDCDGSGIGRRATEPQTRWQLVGQRHAGQPRVLFPLVERDGDVLFPGVITYE